MVEVERQIGVVNPEQLGNREVSRKVSFNLEQEQRPRFELTTEIFSPDTHIRLMDGTAVLRK